jgi:hypothetical protein
MQPGRHLMSLGLDKPLLGPILRHTYVPSREIVMELERRP